jgi:DNA polymerase bacteriophage-type
MPTIHHDLETGSTLDVNEVGAWIYSLHPDTRVWCMAWAVDDGPVQITVPGRDPPPTEWVATVGNPDWRFSAFNTSFERTIAVNLLGPRYSWPVPVLEQYDCSQALALSYALPAALEGVAAALNLSNRKDPIGSAVMKKWAKPRKVRKGEDPNQLHWHDDPKEFEKLCAYCAQDTRVEREVQQRLPPLPAEEQALWQLSELINERGFYTDGALIDAAIRVADWFTADVNRRLTQVTAGGITAVTQIPHRLQWLQQHGYGPDSISKTVLQQQLRRKNLPDIVRCVLEFRVMGAHAAAAKPEAFKRWRAPDGRIRGAFKFCGAHTGRWSSHGAQAQNLKRTDAKLDVAAAVSAVLNDPVEELQRKYPQTLDLIGNLARAIICARPGRQLIAADFSGIEARLTAWLSGDQAELEQWAKFDRTQCDEDEPYFITGHRTFGLPKDQARALGKVGTLASGFMGGVPAWRRLAAMALPEDNVSDEEVLRRRNAWRRDHPRTVKFWGELNRAAIHAVRKKGQIFDCGKVSFIYDDVFLFMRLPSSRRIAYPFARLETNSRGDLVVIHKIWKEKKWQDYRFGHGAYGATWIENAVSATARDLFAATLQRLEGRGYAVVHHTHDEIVAEVAQDFGSTAEFHQMMITLPPWAAGLPMAAKVRVGPRFCKTTRPEEALESVLEEDNSDVEKPPECSIDAIQPTPTAEAPKPRAATAEQTHQMPPPEDLESPEAEDRSPSNSGNSFAADGCPHTDGYQSGEAPRGSPAGKYIYRDANGEPYMRVTRTTGKNFPTAHWLQDRWVYGWPTTVLPYRLPELLTAPTHEALWICEGEKDTDNVAALGLTATTNPGGAKAWQPELAQWFKGKQLIYILEDNDEAGRTHTAKIVAALHGVVPTIVTVTFPELPEKGDVSDWLDAGGNRKLLIARAEEARKRNATQHSYVSVNLSSVTAEAEDWLWQGHLARGKLELLAGTPQIGKSEIQCQYVACVTTARTWPNGQPSGAPRRVIMLTAEDDTARTLVPRLQAAGANLALIEQLKLIRRNNRNELFLLSEDLGILETMIRDFGNVGLTTIDPITAYMGHGKHFDSHRATDVRSQLMPVKDMAERTNVAFSAVTHPPKNAGSDALNHFIGSQAFIAAARIGHLCIAEMEDIPGGGKRETGRRFYTTPKINIWTTPATLAYRIAVVETGFDTTAEKPITAPVIQWEGEVSISAVEAVAAARPTKSNRGASAVEFLVDLLTGGPQPQTLVIERGAERGFSLDQLKRAKQKAGIVSYRKGGLGDSGTWFWALPQHAPADSS